MRSKALDKAEIIDKIFDQLDPVVAAGGILCAGATALGVPPPLTSIVNALSNREMQSNIVDALTWSPVSQAVGWGMGSQGITSWTDIFTGYFGEVKESDREKARRHQGMIMLGAFEGLWMMSLVRNEAALAKFMELGGKIGAATITAAGEAVPF